MKMVFRKWKVLQSVQDRNETLFYRCLKIIKTTSSNFVHFRPLSSTFIHFHPLPPIFIRISTFTHIRPLSLSFRLLMDNFYEMAPIIYTPTVGWACSHFSHLFRRSRGQMSDDDDDVKDDVDDDDDDTYIDD